MSQQTEGNKKTFTGGEDLAVFRRVKLSAGSGSQVEYADSDEAAIGITQDPISNGQPVTLILENAGGTRKVTASEPFSVGADLYAANDGKVTDTDPGSGTIRYKALEAATADGDIVEVIKV